MRIPDDDDGDDDDVDDDDEDDDEMMMVMMMMRSRMVMSLHSYFKVNQIFYDYILTNY